MHPLLTLAIYLAPFIAIVVVARLWMRKKGVGLADVQAEGDPGRENRSRFLLGIWRKEGRE